jgi:hypothetical protein
MPYVLANLSTRSYCIVPDSHFLSHKRETDGRKNRRTGYIGFAMLLFVRTADNVE